jgi:hypothetical protein
MYGTVSSFAITTQTNEYQFKLFHTTNTFITVFVVFVYRILAKTEKRLLEEYTLATQWFGLGLVCWLTDLFLCEYINPIPLHALWHICSSIGVYHITLMLHCAFKKSAAKNSTTGINSSSTLLEKV